MCKSLITFIVSLFPFYVHSQVLPKEGSKLNHRLIGISFPAKQHSPKYKIEIAEGNFKNADAFRKNIILFTKTDSTRIIMEVRSFGTEYTWRVVYDSLKKKESPLYHFSTDNNDRVDTNKLRLKILNATSDYKDTYVSIDGGGVIYDMKGKPMAFIPEINDLGGYIIGMDFTAEGTITFDYIRTAYEINLNGTILWKSPERNPVNGGVIPDIYHHDMCKLPNGHYMVLGMEFIPSLPVVKKDTSYIMLAKGQGTPDGYKYGQYGTIIEFDKDGNVVWSWKDSEHLIGTDFDYFRSPADSFLRFDPHSNSFFFDQKNNAVYLSYRNLNRIIKIDYPSGKISNVYGERFKPGIASLGRDFFCNQHGVKRSMDGYLYCYNNNSCWNTDSLPSVIMFQEPVNATENLKKVWEFTCTVEGDYPKKFGAGGNAIELPDRSMFVCMGNEYSKIFIVNRNKKIMWSALPERYIETETRWAGNRQYRANIINRKELEKLIWNAERTK